MSPKMQGIQLFEVRCSSTEKGQSLCGLLYVQIRAGTFDEKCFSYLTFELRLVAFTDDLEILHPHPAVFGFPGMF